MCIKGKVLLQSELSLWIWICWADASTNKCYFQLIASVYHLSVRVSWNKTNSDLRSQWFLAVGAKSSMDSNKLGRSAKSFRRSHKSQVRVSGSKEAFYLRPEEPWECFTNPHDFGYISELMANRFWQETPMLRDLSTLLSFGIEMGLN